jgi:hypothetical protein
MTWFATATMRMREQGASDARPYTMLSAWASVIPGVQRTDMKLETGYPDGPHPIYGEDNLPDPWTNPTLTLIRQAFNPVAVIDSDFWNANKMSDTSGRWPTTPATIAPGPNTRTLTIFNDTFADDQLSISWTLHAGSPTGKTVDRGALHPQVALGQHRQLAITFSAPDTTQPLYLQLQATKAHSGVLYQDTSTVYAIHTPA